ncbi:hypothetical protein ACIBBB_07315 [Streptomyces sp. NPDC051217]|uniref:hypothetical protein n=1 Tax=Streptomyces sp. NPDC051217 TaxID=3365644 RepID=UPI0037A178F6
MPIQLDLPAGEVSVARDTMARVVVDAYGVDREQAADVGIVGTPTRRPSGSPRTSRRAPTGSS